MYQISVSGHFDSAHHLRDYEGKCARPHGHRWVYTLCFEGDVLNRLLIDFVKIKEVMEARVEKHLDHVDLNELVPFRVINPTAENIAKLIYCDVKEVFFELVSVTVFETPECSATYHEHLIEP